MQYCSCGSIKEFGVCSNKRCPENTEAKNRIWIIDGIELKFKTEVTREYAENHSKEAIVRNVKQINRERQEGTMLKPWTG